MRQVDVNRLLAALERIERKLDRLNAARVRRVSWLESMSEQEKADIRSALEIYHLRKSFS